MGFFTACCGGSRPRRPHKRKSRRRHHHHAAASRVNNVASVAAPVDLRGSGGSDGDWHDARDAFSDGGSFTEGSAPASPRSASGFEQGQSEASYSESGSGSSFSSDEEEAGGLFGACLSIMRDRDPEHHPLHSRAHTPFSKGSGLRLVAGSSFARYDPSTQPEGEPHECWSEADATQIKIRSTDYMRTKAKIPSDKAIYRLVAVDLFATESKALHVAKHTILPQLGPPVMVKSGVSGAPDVALPRLLILNLQLPSYQPSFFGANDGPGQSVIFYYALPEDFDPAKFENKAALGLLTRFVANGRETDGSPTRERLKVIARVVNVEEWAQVGPLSAAELKLLQNYNEKPVLTRPQHYFYTGPGSSYLEVDVDIHSYAFLARKALASYAARLKDVVWEVAVVVQGNCPEELPEQVLGVGRINRTDLLAARPLPAVPHGLSAVSQRADGAAADAAVAVASAPVVVAAAAGARAGTAAAGASGGQVLEHPPEAVGSPTVVVA